MDLMGRRFSFQRFITNVIPNFARDDINDVNLSPRQADDLVQYQLMQPDPRYLDPLSFYIAALVDTKSQSEKVHKALLKNGLISAPPAPGKDAMPPVNTRGITKSFAHQLAIISVHAQRKLVGLLFFWEEECIRWKLLDDEEAEILTAVDVDGANQRDLDLALMSVEMRRKMLPSQRGEPTTNVGSGAGHELPAYAR